MITQAIKDSLTDDLLKPPYTGHCYAASEAYYHMAGGKEAGLKPVNGRHEGVSHWWLQDRDGNVIDLTADQFATPVPYSTGKPKGFLTKLPSKRAQIIIGRANDRLRMQRGNEGTDPCRG